MLGKPQLIFEVANACELKVIAVLKYVLSSEESCVDAGAGYNTKSMERRGAGGGGGKRRTQGLMSRACPGQKKATGSLKVTLCVCTVCVACMLECLSLSVCLCMCLCL